MYRTVGGKRRYIEQERGAVHVLLNYAGGSNVGIEGEMHSPEVGVGSCESEVAEPDGYLIETVGIIVIGITFRGALEIDSHASATVDIDGLQTGRQDDTHLVRVWRPERKDIVLNSRFLMMPKGIST